MTICIMVWFNNVINTNHPERIIEEKRVYNGFTVFVFITKYSSDCYPWLFSIIDNENVEHYYAGMPNQCETKRSALKRAWWRTKWMADGIINERYK